MKALMALLLSFSAVSYAVDVPVSFESRDPLVVSAPETVPGYDFACRDPLYATVIGALQVKNINIEHEKSFDLKVPGFHDKFEVKAVLQKNVAPLVVVLLGISGQTDADYSRLWPSWFAQAGCHVLYFDSTFGPKYQRASQRGVSGNLWTETEGVRDIIATFLDHKDVRGKIGSIHIAGYSYGGSEALILGRMASEESLPFTISSIQAYSPPINFIESAKILDTWFTQDRWNYTAGELRNMFLNPPSCEERDPAKIPDSACRGAISASFRLELAKTVLANDSVYELKVLPKEEDDYILEDFAAGYGYSNFAKDFMLPYWSSKIGADKVYQLVAKSNVCDLVRFQPAYSEIIIANDDPLNSPESMAALHACATGHHVTFLPRGGHMGFVADPWTKAKLLSILDK